MIKNVFRFFVCMAMGISLSWAQSTIEHVEEQGVKEISNSNIVNQRITATRKNSGEQVEGLVSYWNDKIVARTIRSKENWLWTDFFSAVGDLTFYWSTTDYKMYSTKKESLTGVQNNEFERFSNSIYQVNPKTSCLGSESPCVDLVFSNHLTLEKAKYPVSPITIVKAGSPMSPSPSLWDKKFKITEPIVVGIWSPFDFSHPDLFYRVPTQFFIDHEGQTLEVFSGRRHNENHDTQCAGILSKDSNMIQIVPAKHRSLMTAQEDIEDLARYNVRIISASFGDILDSQSPVVAEYQKLVEKHKSRILFISSAGNNGEDNEKGNHFPSNLEGDNTLSVTQIGKDGDLLKVDDKYQVNYSRLLVDVAAPIHDVPFAPIPEGGTAYYDARTSHASQWVANITARILLINPKLSPAQVKSIITSTVDGFDRYPLLKDKIKFGVVNPDRAFDAAKKSIRIQK